MVETRHPPILEALLDRGVGFAVVHAPREPLTRVAALIDETLGASFRHIGVFPAFPDWKPIGVNPELEDFRVGGTGFIPLHIDFVNASHPPDIVAFYCEREDMLGGGASILANKAATLAKLSEAIVEQLRETEVHEGKFFALRNLGVECNPFPLLDNRFLRFTGKKLCDDGAFSGRDILLRVEEAAMQVAMRVTLRAGDVLLINQRECLHGRERLVRDTRDQVFLGRKLHQRFYRMIE